MSGEYSYNDTEESVEILDPQGDLIGCVTLVAQADELTDCLNNGEGGFTIDIDRTGNSAVLSYVSLLDADNDLVATAVSETSAAALLSHLNRND